MTIYAKGLIDATLFLQGLVENAGDLEKAAAFEISEINRAAILLKEAIADAVVELDKQIGSDGSGGIGEVVSGVFPIDVVNVTVEQLANIEQMTKLLEMGGYAGRVLINVGQAG